jgi:phosphoribosylanthranilate isomerase
MTEVKICGVCDPATAIAAAEAGASYIGLNFYPPSRRVVTARQAAHIKTSLPEQTRAVGLFVNPIDSLLDEVLGLVNLDMIQLHGDEPPERVAEIRHAYGRPVVKAIPVATALDLRTAHLHKTAADMLLFDAKPRRGGLPGGNGLPFDWQLLSGTHWPIPWMLSGGLTPKNVSRAIRMSGAKIVDVSSGVEDRPGRKSVGLMQDFIRAVINVS